MIEQNLKEYLDQQFKQLDLKFRQIDDRFQQIEEKFDKIDQRFDKVDQRFDKVDQRLEKIEEDMTDLKIGQAKLETKIDGLDKRLEFQEFINRSVVIGFILAILGGLAKLFGLVGNP
jgi:hypothetical protein